MEANHAALETTCQALLSATSETQVAGHLLRTLVDAVRPTGILLMLRQLKKEELVQTGTHGFAPDVQPTHPLPFVNFVQTHREGLLLHAGDSHPLWEQRDPNVQSILCLPILRSGQLCGVLYMESTRADGDFNPAHQRFTETLLAPTALALDSLTMLAKMRDLEHDLRNALGAASLLLFQVLGAEQPMAGTATASLNETKAAELKQLRALAEALGNDDDRDSYLNHVELLEGAHETTSELLQGVRTAVNRALKMTMSLEDRPLDPRARFAQASAAGRFRSSR